MKTGFEIFRDAVMAVLRNPGVALKVLWLPFLLSWGVFVVAERASDPDALIPLLATYLVDAVAVALLAVGWHRYRLLGEDPSAIGTRSDPKRVMSYAVTWLVLGAIIGLIVFSAVALPSVALYLVAPDEVLGFLDETSTGYWSAPGAVAFLLVIWLFTWLIFRLTLSLPQLAIRAEAGPRFASWRESARLEPGVVVCAVLAALGTFVLLAPVNYAYSLFSFDFIFQNPSPAPEERYRFAPQYYAVTTFCWMLIPLFGASILTELYRRLNLEEGPSA